MLWTEESSLQEQPVLTAAEIHACDCGRGSSMEKTWGRLFAFVLVHVEKYLARIWATLLEHLGRDEQFIYKKTNEKRDILI